MLTLESLMSKTPTDRKSRHGGNHGGSWTIVLVTKGDAPLKK
jgi:hypothetical protein